LRQIVAASEVGAIMGELLDTEDVENDDNFFEIGGNSFIALNFISIIKARFGMELTMLDLIRSATPHEISAILNEVAGRR